MFLVADNVIKINKIPRSSTALSFPPFIVLIVGVPVDIWGIIIVWKVEKFTIFGGFNSEFQYIYSNRQITKNISPFKTLGSVKKPSPQPPGSS